MATRFFMTCGSGFILRHLLKPLLEKHPDATLSLLFLADSQERADAYLKNLIDFVGIHPKDGWRLKALPGDLRLPKLGLKDIQSIDANVWINGTLPFRFGSVRPESARIAQLTDKNFLELMGAYYRDCEEVAHYVEISSIRVSGLASNRLPESLNYEHVTIGNFDYCKHLIETSIRDWLATAEIPVKTTVIRIESLLSSTAPQVGGMILLLSKELLGLGRYSNKPEYLFADSEGIIRFSPVESVVHSILQLLLNIPEGQVRVINLANTYDKVTTADFVEIIDELRDQNPKLQIKSPESLYSDQSLNPKAREYYMWLLDSFGWLTLSKATHNDPHVEVAEYLLGRPWLSFDNLPGGKAREFLKTVISAALQKEFRSTIPNIGEMPVY
jgi:hypothetical protein